MVNQDLIRFIKEARNRSFEDFEIRAPLIKVGWPKDEIELAFEELKKKQEKQFSGAKVQIKISLDKKVYKILDSRARKNILSIEEQVEDIIRRSAVLSLKKQPKAEKIDDLLVGIFSRKKKK
jgi:hypothetical protein